VNTRIEPRTMLAIYNIFSRNVSISKKLPRSKKENGWTTSLRQTESQLVNLLSIRGPQHITYTFNTCTMKVLFYVGLNIV